MHSTSVIDSMMLVQGSQQLSLFPNDRFLLRSLNIGDPSTREVIRPRVGSHGTVDETEFLGERGVSVGLRITEKPYSSVLDELSVFRDPSRRSELRVKMAGQDERLLIVRPDQFSAPFTMDSRTTLDWLGQWKAPDPRWYSLTQNRLLVYPGDEAPGFSFDLEFDLSFPPSTGVGVLQADNKGTVSVHPVIRIFGPCTNPKISNETTGKVLHFNDLSIAEGDYLDIRPLTRTIRLNSLPEQNRYRYLDTSISEWWELKPGKQDIRFYPSSYSDPCVAELSWRSAWL